MHHKLYYATDNYGQFYQLRESLSSYLIEVEQTNIPVPSLLKGDIKETALHKCEYVFQQLQKPTVVSVSSFYIHSLNGFPQTHAPFVLETIGLEGILKLMEGKRDRSCEWIDCIAFKEASHTDTKLFVGHIPGQLAYRQRGEKRTFHASPFTLIFKPLGEENTIAEMPLIDYQAWQDNADDLYFPERLFTKWFTHTSRIV